MRQLEKFSSLAELKNMTIGLDKAESRPVFTKSSDGALVPLETFQCIWNRDENRVSNITSKGYTLVQHEEVLGSFIDTVGKFNMSCFGNLRNCNDKVIVELAFKSLVVQDAVNLGVKFVNSFDRTHSISGEFFGYRTACANGMLLGKVLQGVTMVRQHIGKIDVRDMMEQFIRKVINSSEQLNELVSRSMVTSLEWQTTLDLIDALNLNKKHRESIKSALLFKKEDMTRQLTKWDVYNVITAYATHGRSIGDYIEGKLQNEAQRVLLNPIEKLVEVK